MGRFEQPDFSQGDPNTIGGYRAAHGRPPAFESSDGIAYSVEIVADEASDGQDGWAAYLLFVRWRSSDPVATGHMESDYLAFAPTEAEAVGQLGAMPLQTAREYLERLLRERDGGSGDGQNGQRT